MGPVPTFIYALLSITLGQSWPALIHRGFIMFSFLARMRNRKEALARLDRAVGFTSLKHEAVEEPTTGLALIIVGIILGTDIYFFFLG